MNELSQTETGVAALAAVDADALRRVRSHLRRVYDAKQVTTLSERSIPVFPTGLAEPAGGFLRDLVVRERAGSTIETGFGLGLSAMFMIEGMLAGGAGGTARHTAIDPYQHRDWSGAALRLLADAGVDQSVEFVEEDSLTALPRFLIEGRTFDFGFVDGGHTFDCVFADVLYLCRLVRPGGVIVLDDILLPSVGAVSRFFQSNMGCVAEQLARGIAKRFAVLRTPAAPVSRQWDHFVPFW